MTRHDILELLKVLRGAYPTYRITDPSGMVNTWELAFGQDKAEEIYKAARYHMDHSPYFPTIADIKRAINKGGLVYGESSARANSGYLEGKKIDPGISFCDSCGLCDRKQQELCEF